MALKYRSSLFAVYAETLFLSRSKAEVPKRQTEEIAVCVARDFESFYSRRKIEKPEPTSDILAMSVDQKGVVMRKEDLRASSRKAAEEAKHRPDSRLNPGERRNRKRMATVATVYSLEP